MFIIYFLKPFMKHENSVNRFPEFSLSCKTFLLNLFSCLINSLLSMTFWGTKQMKVVFSDLWMKRILILMQLQDFNRIKHRGGMENCFCLCLSKKITDIWESSHWELFCKKDLRCVFDWKFEVFWIVKRRIALTKLGALLKICLFAWDIAVFWIIIGGHT